MKSVTAGVEIEELPSDLPTGIDALFIHEYAGLARLAFLLTQDRSAAEELAMEAFARALAGWRRIGSMDRPDLYLRRIVVNLCASNVRRRAVERRANARVASQRLDVPAVYPPDPSVLKAVSELPVRQRACVVLRYYEDRPEAEIADVLRCSVGTVKSQLSKARQTLARALRVLEQQGDRDE
ncbi:MAG TPA: SigE family RNA polymerase sigma factor [Actinomycetota bacterium]|nr:SigE family RNA polymerase sigma factor [Actinomycetota bacterium]